MDFGYALVNILGQLKKVAFFVIALPYSDAIYVQAFDKICMESMWEGHVRTFRFFQGVPYRISYDNEKVIIYFKIISVESSDRMKKVSLRLW